MFFSCKCRQKTLQIDSDLPNFLPCSINFIFRIKRISQRIWPVIKLQQTFLLIMYHMAIVIKDVVRVNPNGLEDHITLEDHMINLKSRQIGQVKETTVLNEDGYWKNVIKDHMRTTTEKPELNRKCEKECSNDFYIMLHSYIKKGYACDLICM